jgi:hypothetical protein
VSVQEGVVVALNLQVDPAESRISASADRGDRPTQRGHVAEEELLFGQRQVVQLIGVRTVGDEHAVATGRCWRSPMTAKPARMRRNTVGSVPARADPTRSEV